MKNITAQSLEILYMEFEKADNFFPESGLKDMDAYEIQLAEAARRAAAEHMEAMYNSLDQSLCQDVSRETVQRLRCRWKQRKAVTSGQQRYWDEIGKLVKQQ